MILASYLSPEKTIRSQASLSMLGYHGFSNRINRPCTSLECYSNGKSCKIANIKARKPAELLLHIFVKSYQ